MSKFFQIAGGQARRHSAEELRKAATRRTRIFVRLDAAEREALIGPTPAWDDDKAWAAYNRAELKIMRVRLQEWLATDEGKAFGIDYSTIKFSRRAGCPVCPCSPGFVTTTVARFDGDSVAAVYLGA